ncbi:MAG: acetate--CoA ligase, partial [Actinomycetota bacterium]|nr:acetate--CoA ligase [Actinomycetota bacterium]
MATEERTDKSLEEELEKLLEVERFPPPEEFRANAVLQDPAIYEEAERDPEGFWAEQAKRLDWFEGWDEVLDWSNPPFAKWFVGGKLNASYNCLDRHVEAGLGDRIAFHWRGEEGEERDISYADLHRDVQRFANVLKDNGIGKGDIVGIFLPMIPEVVVAMLACARIGAPHNVVFGGFSAESVKERMEFSDAKALVTVDGARRKGKTAPIKQQVDEVMGEVATMETIFVVKHTGEDCEMQDGRDVWFGEAMDAADAECPAEPLDAEHPLYVLYTSGSTAKPKGILHTTGGYLTGAAYTHRVVFDLKPESDVFWCGADVGWVTGHSYIVYGPLANGATSVMYEGAPDYPDKDIWWEIIERYGVTIFYTAPTAIRACMKWGPEYPGRHDLSSLRLLGTVGEPINPKAWLWYYLVIGGERCPIVDTWWQTETGHIMISPLPGITETKPGSATFPLPGIAAAVVDERSGEDAGTNQGLLVLTRPWPGMLRTLYRDDERYVETYWSRFGRETYLVGDAARKDKDGYFWIIGRID